MKHTVNWGIIGLGNIALEFAKSFYNVDNADIIAVASTSQKKLTEFKQEFQIKTENLYDNYEKLIEDENIDIIYIALPNSFHFEWVLKAIEKNKNILIEKPAFLNLKNAKMIFNHQNFKNIFFSKILEKKYIPKLFSKMFEKHPEFRKKWNSRKKSQHSYQIHTENLAFATRASQNFKKYLKNQIFTF